MPSVSKAALHQLLKATGREKFHIEYGGFLSNHISHGIIALYYLGATEDVLARFVDRYIQQHISNAPPQLEEQEAVSESSLDQWKGARKNFLGVAAFLEREKTTLKSVSSVVTKYTPQLLDGGHASALHPIIHLGFGLKVADEDMVVDGLSYMVYSYNPMSTSPEAVLELIKRRQAGTDVQEASNAKSHQPTTLSEALRAIKTSGKYDGLLEHYTQQEKYSSRVPAMGKFQMKLSILAEEADGQDLINQYAACLLPHIISKSRAGHSSVADITLDEVIEAYGLAERDDFFLLHAVTSAWALREILRHVPETLHIQVIAHFVRVALAVYVVQGMPLIREKALESTGEELPSREAIEEATLKAAQVDDEVDEHLFKLVFVCLEREQELRNSILEDQKMEESEARRLADIARIVAAKKAGLLGW